MQTAKTETAGPAKHPEAQESRTSQHLLQVAESEAGPIPSLRGNAPHPAPNQLRGNIENYIGMTQVPTGLIGPLRIDGGHVVGDVYVPLATSEGALVASYNRGARLITRAGGVVSRCTGQEIQRVPCMVFQGIRRAIKFSEWVVGRAEELRCAVARESKHTRLLRVTPLLEGNRVYVVLGFQTADAAGQNMATFCAEAICRHIHANSPIPVRKWFLESNMAGDKKATAMSLGHGRGRRVIADVTLPRELTLDGLRTSPEDMVAYWNTSVVGALQSGAVGHTGHVANGLAALYLACGQDVAAVAEAAVGITRLELTEGRDLYCSLTLPCLSVGTVGGGTGLPTARECMRILGCEGSGQGDRFAEICGAVALAGEISIAGAMAAGEFSKAHRRLGRRGWETP